MLERMRQRITGVEPVTETAPEPPVPLSYPGLSEHRMKVLVGAIHERWHGDHTPERGKDECARQAGADLDIAAIAPLISSWIVEAEQTALLEAAATAERVYRISTTRSRDVDPTDLHWWKADPQAALRKAMLATPYSSTPLLGVATWLRTLAGRQS